jgi:carboxyl-terminal processing protease
VDARDVAVNVARLASQRLALSPAATAIEFTCGATCALDPYSCFLTGDELDETFSQIEGNFVGLGIELKAQDRSLLVVNVIPGGPAEQAGMHSGDRIVEVDGTATTTVSTDEAADLLKGPDGTAVHLTVVDEKGVTKPLRLVRRVVEVPSVDSIKIVDTQCGIGYLRMTSFQKNTSRDFDQALWQLDRQGMRSLILDLRGNPGGLLTAAVDVADKFVPSGIIVSTRGRDAHEDYDYQARSPGTWNLPLFVLIDGDTASASEILAGALRDHRRATVVGQRSYGKGSVQGIFSLTTTKAGVRLTTAKFYSPSGQPIAQRGVTPDVAVHTVKKPLTQGESLATPADDPVLNAALQLARNSLLTQNRP